MTREEVIQKTNCFIHNRLKKYRFTKQEIDFCKAVINERNRLRIEWNQKHPFRIIKNSKISRNHKDTDLWWGLLCELLLCREYGNDTIKQQWAEDQLRQNIQLKKEGYFDCKDVGNTQVRAAEYSEEKMRRLIYRQNDFYTKSCQPVIGCVIDTNPNDMWAVICGFFSWEDLKNRRLEFWGDPDNHGYYAMWIPFWKLTPMDKFDSTYLL